MTNRTRKKLIFACMGGAILLAGTFFNGCRVDPKVLPETTSEQVKFYIPDGFPQPVYTFAGNEVTLAGFTLGRKLFYDPRLSADNTISCGFCHQAPASFANANHALSHGIGGQFGRRNAPVLVNLAWNQSFMWDGGINHIENQPPAPIQNPVEMGETMSNVILKLSAVPSYHDDFKAAFGDDSITTQRICRALAQFMGVMISADSKYDKYRRGEASLTSQEADGLATFRTKCAGCHPEPLFTDEGFHNIGLPVDNTLNDEGRMHITLDPADSLKFRTPTLRNVALSGPYMHDGRFTTLQQCMDFFTDGVQAGPTLDTLMTPDTGIPLTPQEKSDLIAFMGTLTDMSFIQDPKFKEQH